MVKRQADEYDAAQKRGEIARLGSNQTQVGVPEGNTLPSAAEIGLSRKDIHEARIIRDAMNLFSVPNLYAPCDAPTPEQRLVVQLWSLEVVFGNSTHVCSSA